MQWKPKLSTGYIGINCSPKVITHSSPVSIHAHFYSSIQTGGTSTQSDAAMTTPYSRVDPMKYIHWNFDGNNSTLHFLINLPRFYFTNFHKTGFYEQLLLLHHSHTLMFKHTNCDCPECWITNCSRFCTTKFSTNCHTCKYCLKLISKGNSNRMWNLDTWLSCSVPKASVCSTGKIMHI